MPGKNRYQSGLTLIETLIYVFLAVLVVGTIATATVWTLKAGAKTKSTVEVLANAQQAMETLIFEIRKAQSVYTPTSIFLSAPGQLSLEQSSALLPGETETFIDFFVCEQALCLKRESGNPIRLTNNRVKVSSLSFTRLSNSENNPSIRIELTVETAADSSFFTAEPLELQTTVNLRNYTGG